MSLILDKVGFGPQVINFFSNYLVNRKTSYFWNNFSSQSFDVNVGVGQGSALSPILSTLYLSPFFHIFEKHIKNLDLKISTLSFVDDGLLITQSKSFHLSKLREFFNHRDTNSIEFQECPSKDNWHLHKAVDSDTKLFNLIPLLLNKYSWDFSKKLESNNILNTWKMTFQASDLKGRNFLELVNSNNIPLEPTYCKGGSWLQFFGYSNSLCARATRAITNHAPIGEYCLKFFLNKDFSCLYGLYPIETR